MKKFNTFCIKYKVGDPFPATEQLLCSYAAYLANRDLAPQIIKSYLAAVRDMQISIGLPDPRYQSSLPILKRVQAGINRARGSDNQPREVRLPITPHLLRQIRAALDSSRNPEKMTLWAVCCTAFFGFFQLGELLLATAVTFKPGQHLAWGDVAVDNPQDPGMIRIYLKQSKTDQTGQEVHIILGRTGADLCSVAAVLGYIAIRRARPGPFRLNSRGEPLLKHVFVDEIHRIMGDIGFPQHQYAGHSFRIGAAIVAVALAGLEDSTIQLLGRWQIAAFLRYIRTPHDKLAALSPTLIWQENI